MSDIARIRDAKTSLATSDKQKILLKAQPMTSPLEGSGFFVTYPHFHLQRQEIDDELGFLIHNTRKNLERAVEEYFGSTFKGFVIELYAKPRGSQGMQVNAFLLRIILI